MESYLSARKDSVVFYKVNLLLDVEFEDETYNASNKLNSFFGQIGVYENSERLINLINNFYKDLDFSFLMFKEKSDFKKEEELLDGNENSEMFFKSNDDFYYYDNEVEEVFNEESITQIENVEEDLKIVEQVGKSKFDEDENKDENKDENEDENEDESYFFFFLPLIMVFYRGDRKMDYFLGNEFKEKLFFKEKIILFKEKLYVKKFLKKNFFFKKSYKKNSFVKKFNKNKNNFFNLIKNSNIVFLVKDFFKYHFFDIKKRISLSRKKRFKLFKKIKLKFRSKMINLCKDSKWWNTVYIFFLLNLKLFFLSNYYSHKNYLIGIFNFFSQMINVKKKFFRRYRRKRRFKKDFFINFFGERAKLDVIINDFEEDNNNKKKGKKKR